MNIPDEPQFFSSGYLRLMASIQSDAGRKRSTNEDYAAAYLPDDQQTAQTSGSLFIVADGVGSRTRGEETSRYATRRVLAGYYEMEDLPPGDRLRNILQEIGNELYFQSSSEQPARGATTLVAAAVKHNLLTVANVGDSRAYLIHDGHAQQITRDHNQFSELLRLGALSVEEVENASGINRLTRSLGGQSDVEVDIFEDIPLYPDDMLLLCSDGLTRYIDDEQIALLSSMGDPDQVCQLLVDWANKSGGEDNITVLVVGIYADDQFLAWEHPQEEETQLEPGLLPFQTGQPDGALRKRDFKPVMNRLLVPGLVIAGMILLILLVWQAFVRLSSREPPIQPAATNTAAVSQILPAPATLDASPTGPRIIETQVIVEQPEPAILSPTAQRQGNTCIWTVETGQSLFSIIRRFELAYNASEAYFYYETCDLDQTTCTGAPTEIGSHASIFAGWNVIIPDVDAETCTGQAGIWVQAEN